MQIPPPAAPSAAPAPVPAQIPAAHTTPISPADAAHAVLAAPPAPTAPHAPARPMPSTPPAQPAPTAAPPAKTAAPPPSAPPVTTPTVVDPANPEPTEAQLEKQVEALWQDHKQAKSSARKTNKELALIRADLARALHSLKNVFARPGCKGEWSSFLDGHSISRTTADRLVSAHEKSLAQPESNGTDGATEESTEAVVSRCLDRYWKRLSPVLSTPEAVELFIDGLRNLAQKSFGADDEASDSSASDVAAQTE